MVDGRLGIEKISEGISLFFQGFGEILSEVASAVSKIIESINWKLLVKISNDPKIKKYLAIYHRTKKSRIKKKQIKKIKAILYGG